MNNGDQSAAQLTYVRLDNLGAGVFQAYRGTGPDDNNITWTPLMDGMMMPQTQTNANLVGQTLQVGVAAGAIGALPGASALWDWVEIQTTTQTYRDDFSYTRNFGVDGVLGFNPAATTGGAIWNNIVNGAAGGINTQSGPNLGRCLTCTWNVNGSGDFNGLNNWTPSLLFGPGGNDVTALFGTALVASPATVYTNSAVTLKQIDFDNAGTYVLGGPGSFTLDADIGSAAINVLQGAHEIQTELILNDNVTATAAAGATLNINASVVLNGLTFTTAGAGIISLNNGTIAVGPGAGSGALVNDGNLSGLGSVGGDFTQTDGGSLAVEVGGGVAQVLGDAALDGTLNISLADGFTPTVGQSYTVLTAGSVIDSGLSLSGAAASLFSLEVGPGSVSLVAVGVPEPATMLLASLGLALGAFLRRNRRPNRRCVGERQRMYRFFCALAVFFVVGSSATRADVLLFGPAEEPVTYRDEFSAFFDYGHGGGTAAVGTITSSLGGPNKSWTATHNPTTGGDPLQGPAFEAPFVANGNDSQGAAHPNSLWIEDFVFHPNTDLSLGMGWEGNKTSGPVPYVNVRAEDSFDAVIKINSQTAGNWSYASILARRAGPGVGRTVGDMLEPTERFVTMGSFRADAALPNDATLLTQNILELDNTDPTPEEAEMNTGPATVGLPLWVRMSKNGGQLQSFTSLDGVNWTLRNTVFNTDLNIMGELLEVGPTFTLHNGSPVPAPGIAEGAEFDFFEITVRKTERPLDATWAPAAANASGNWNTAANWTSMSLAQAPDANSTDVTLGDANAGPATIFNNRATPNIVRSLTFSSPNPYAISGAGGITLEPDPQSLIDVDQTYINVQSGSHQIDVDLAISAAALADNRITAAAGAQLDINNTFNLNGKTVNIQGAGRVNINNNIDLANGTVFIAGGNLGGSGRINGPLTNGSATIPGGTVNPGTSVGTLTVEGIFNQAATGTTNIELGGTAAGQFDKLISTSAMIVNGKIDVSLVNGFVPAVGNLFEIFTAVSNINVPALATTLVAADEPFYQLILTNSGAIHKLELRVDVVPPVGLLGDYNEDDVVDAADYVIWRKNGTNPLPNDNGLTTATQRYNLWRASFGDTSPGSGSGIAQSAVPEPGSAALAALGLAALLSITRRRS